MRQLLLILGCSRSPSACSGSARAGRDQLAPSSFMIKQIQWAGYGAALAALGLVLIWQSKR